MLLVFTTTAVNSSSVTTAVGSDLELSCDSLQEPTWTFNGETLPFNAIARQDSHIGISRLTITLVTQANSGMYTCHGISSLGTAFSDKITVVVNRKSPNSSFF